MPEENKKNQATPNNLPILDEEKFEIHTMQDDLKKTEEGELKDNTGLPEESKKEATSDLKSERHKFSIPVPPKPPLEGEANISNNNVFTSEQKKPEKEEKVISPDDIKIPTHNRSNIIILAGSVLVLLLVVLGGVFYWYYFLKKEKGNQEVKQEISVTVPEPKVKDVQKPEPKKEEPKKVEIPEPKKPEAVLNFQNLQILGASTKDRNVFISQIKQREIEIPKSSVITRYIFKLSNDKEKRYITKKELFSLLQINLPFRVWDYIKNIDFISYKIGDSVRYGFVASITDKNIVLSELEKRGVVNLINDLRSLYMGIPVTIPQNPKFSKNSYLNFEKRYINLPNPSVSLDIAVSDKYLVVATSKDMVYAVLVFIGGSKKDQPLQNQGPAKATN